MIRVSNPILEECNLDHNTPPLGEHLPLSSIYIFQACNPKVPFRNLKFSQLSVRLPSCLVLLGASHFKSPHTVAGMKVGFLLPPLRDIGPSNSWGLAVPTMNGPF